MNDKAKADAPALLVLDASYTFEMIRARGLEESVRYRDLRGFFRHVWSVHPFATLLTSDGWMERYGPPQWHRLNERHTFIEGKIGRSRKLARLFPLNFLLAQFGLFLTLLRLARRERISAVRTGDPLYLGLFGLALARLAGVPFVIRVNGNNDKVRETVGRPMLPRLFRSIRFEKAVERFVLPRADWVFAPNQNNIDFAVANGARAETTAIIPFGSLIDNRHFADPAQRPTADADLGALGLKKGRFLLCIGRLEAPKFPDHVVLALEVLHKRRLDFALVFAGGGSMEEALAAMAGERGLSEKLIVAGNRDQGWLSRVLPAAAMVVSPSSGRALSEAALAGAPIVAYDTDWQGDLVRSGETGILVPYKDWQALAEGCVQLASQPDLAGRLGAAARTKALEMLDPEVGIRHERAIYERLLGLGPVPPLT